MERAGAGGGESSSGGKRDVPFLGLQGAQGAQGTEPV